jgi:hypothetical protein
MKLRDFVLFVGCELICFAILSFAHLSLLLGDLKNIEYFQKSYPFVNSMTIIIPLLFGVCFILLAYFWKRIGGLGLTIIIASLFTITIYLIWAANNKINPTPYDYFILNYSVYLFSLCFIWWITYQIHKRINSRLEH